MLAGKVQGSDSSDPACLSDSDSCPRFSILRFLESRLRIVRDASKIHSNIYKHAKKSAPSISDNLKTRWSCLATFATLPTLLICPSKHRNSGPDTLNDVLHLLQVTPSSYTAKGFRQHIGRQGRRHKGISLPCYEPGEGEPPVLATLQRATAASH